MGDLLLERETLAADSSRGKNDRFGRRLAEVHRRYCSAYIRKDAASEGLGDWCLRMCVHECKECVHAEDEKKKKREKEKEKNENEKKQGNVMTAHPAP